MTYQTRPDYVVVTFQKNSLDMKSISYALNRSSNTQTSVPYQIKISFMDREIIFTMPLITVFGLCLSCKKYLLVNDDISYTSAKIRNGGPHIYHQCTTKNER